VGPNGWGSRKRKTALPDGPAKGHGEQFFYGWFYIGDNRAASW